MGFCGTCGMNQPDGAFFCFKCGTSLMQMDSQGGSVATSPTNGSPSGARSRGRRSSPARSVSPPPNAAGRPSIRITKDKYSVVPPFAVGGCLEYSDDSSNAGARYKVQAAVTPQPSPHRSRSSNTARRTGRAFIENRHIEESSRDAIFPDTIEPDQTTPPRLRQLREDRERVRKGVKTDAELLNEVEGTIRKFKIKKKYLVSKNGFVTDEDMIVVDITKGGAADLAGLKHGMKLLQVDGVWVYDSASATKLMRSKEFHVLMAEPDEVQSSPSSAATSPVVHSRSPVHRGGGGGGGGSGGGHITPERRRSQETIWRATHPHEEWEDHSYDRERDVPTKQNQRSKALSRKHHEKQKRLNEFHNNDSGMVFNTNANNRRSRTPPERSNSADTEHYLRNPTAITISPPRANKKGGRSHSAAAGKPALKNLNLNEQFFKKDTTTPGRLKYDKSSAGIEIYTSPRRLAYDEPVMQPTNSIDAPVLSTYSVPTPPTAGTDYASGPVSQPVPQPSHTASEEASLRFRSRMGRFESEQANSMRRGDQSNVSHSGQGAYHSEPDAFEPDSMAYVPTERQLSTSETWPSDPTFRARTQLPSNVKKCTCDKSPFSLTRSYNCTFCNANCCMDCYWMGKCLHCRDDHVSKFKWQESPNLIQPGDDLGTAFNRPLSAKKIRNRTRQSDIRYAGKLLQKLSVH
eukprot:TRINITY_DN8609_c0_g1_i1.p1 TRINITY_DN8609_c0_g1~~TRINITY_DN8609_c0_g1_i1.p1  ORF type:complete len:688 (+),score=114.17 TRINITY_DN8609_c0_g1_i1:83-2146(+)